MSTAAIQFPYPGIQVHQNQHGARVLRLHWTADPDKASGEQIYVEAIKKHLSPWAHREYQKMSNPALYLQEYEIDASATEGALIYVMDKDATLVDPFRIPPDWTRHYCIDPHPRVPHCSLWMAIDRWGDGWLYREYWPSKMYGKDGNIPEDDYKIRIKEYCEVIQYLESRENPENRDAHGKPFDEQIEKRVIDYAARAFGKGTADDPEQPNFQQRFEDRAGEIAKEKDVNFRMEFEDAKKDHDVGYETVNDWLKPRDVEDHDTGTFVKRSKLHIFKSCAELIYELNHVRWKQLTAIQAETQDPSSKQVEKRNHAVDCLRYLCMANPQFVERVKRSDEYTPPIPGLAY
jgi:hypothetical protein